MDQRLSSGGHLRVQDLVSGYGPTRIVDGVSIDLPAGRSLAILGRNGVGKTTLINTIAGRTTHHAGSIALDSVDMTAARPYERCRSGVGLIPQDRQVFRSLTVEENLLVADLRRGWTIDDTFALFPRLAERRRNLGANLSGGEQQMLAIGRALMGKPSCLLLDEPFEGLAPVIVESLIEALRRLKDEIGLTMLMVEQHAKVALELSDQAIVLDRGAVALEGNSIDLLGRWNEVEKLLTVH